MKKLLTTILLACCSILPALAQQDLLIYHMTDVPQAGYVNVASRPTSRVNVGIPLLSSMYFRQQNTVFNPGNMFETRGGTTYFTTDEWLKQVRDRNILGMDMSMDLLSVGITLAEQNYISLDIRERISGRLMLPGDLLRFPFTGNASFGELEDGTLDFSDMRLSFNHYREYGLRWTREWNENLNTGIRVKYLYGMENFDTKRSSYSWRTDPQTWNWEMSGEMAAFSSGFASLTDTIDGNSDLEIGEVGHYLFGRGNHGLGFDIGASYMAMDRLKVSLNVADLGFISWKNDNSNWVSNNGQFVYTGIPYSSEYLGLEDSGEDTINDIVDQIYDDLEEQLSLRENRSAYKSSLHTRIYVGAEYGLYALDNLEGKASLLLQSEVYKGHLRPTVTLGYQQRVGNWLSLTLAYSVMDRDFRNLGLGLRLNGGPIQFYVMVDNLMAARMSKMKFDAASDDGITYPTYAKNVHFHTGINLTFGRKKKDRDGDGVADKKDACPDIWGLEVFGGCPDTDKDGVPDAQDACPETPGLHDFQGCPDTDSDGIADREDECPEVAGIPEFQGCPDTDLDGIKDQDDDCPEIAGLTAFGGCPDTDEDGIMDKEDNCPLEAGPKENQGCPWGDQDGDGIKDNEDLCPAQAGPADNQGCPYNDTDQDGVIDPEDECPLTPGPVENKGCPVIEEEEQEVLNTAFENLEFLSGKSVIKEESYKSLEELAALLAKKPDWKLRISGHTDNVGNDAMNMKLSEERSKAVAKFLSDRGVDAERLLVEWHGEEQPIADNSTDSGRQKNRRVEMEVKFD